MQAVFSRCFPMLTVMQRLVILGSYGVKVKSGEATIYGATLPSSDLIHWIHASHCHALPVLRCSEKSSIELHPHPAANDLRELEKLSPVFGNLWNDLDSGKAVDKQTWQILASSADGPKKAMLQDLKSPAEWNRKISGLVKTPQHDNPVLLICGPKSSGKSTFARIVSNRLLTHRGGTKKRIWPVVAVLDIDPGQPEFSPPGSISLVTLDEPNLSPPFCHPAPGSEHLMRSHAIASITPASDVEHYKRCVLDLFSHYKAMATNCPLIINTPGWIQGSGLVLLRDLIAAISPSEVLYMSEDGPEDTVEGLRSACHSAVLTTLPSQSSEFTSRTALHLRHMQAMSYFHLAASGPGDSTRWDPAPLTSTPPWLVRYSGTDSGILAVACYGYQPLPELLAETIDGTVVAVVEVEQQLFAGADGQQHDELHPHIERTPEQIPYLRGARADRPLDPARSRCLGLALVRGVDRNRALLALSTPLQMDVLASATMRDGKALVLVAGKFDAPTWAYTEDHYNRAHRRRAGGAVGEGIEDDEESASGHIPWVERLHGGQKRAVGSRVWRVRRDLGRSNSAGGGGD